MLSGTHNDQPPITSYLLISPNAIALTYVIQIENEAQGTWVEAFVDAHSGSLVGLTDFVSKASYLVLPITKETPPEGFENLVDPQNLQASPYGWHNTGSGTDSNTA